LVTNILIIEGFLAQNDLEHSDDAAEGKFVKSFFEGLVFIHDSDVSDTVHLVEALNAMFDELSKLDSGVNGVRHTLDDNLLLILSLEEVVSSLQVAADSDLVLNADFVRRELFDSLVDSLVFVSHDGEVVV